MKTVFAAVFSCINPFFSPKSKNVFMTLSYSADTIFLLKSLYLNASPHGVYWLIMLTKVSHGSFSLIHLSIFYGLSRIARQYEMADYKSPLHQTVFKHIGFGLTSHLEYSFGGLFKIVGSRRILCRNIRVIIF